MANVKVAVRVRPLSARETADGGKLAVQVEDKLVRIRNVKLDGRSEGAVDSREKLLEFCFDYCYWSVDPADPHYASQEEVFQDLGVSVLAGASEGYNVCLFAYGQTGSGKTYTMMGAPESVGLTPRICQGLFCPEDSFSDGQNSSRVEISFLEIYNERVRDLLRGGEQKKRTSLRVREHPDKGPYVEDLSQHMVTDCKQAIDLLEEGVANRMTAATHNHDTSSRSHAIFTIQYTQAILENNLPSETVSKINLVDLAGSERADPQYCRDRLTEGSSINKSLVTLGIVISALAQNSQMSSSCQSINSVASEGDSSTLGSHSSSLSGGGGGGGGRRHCFIPYRDSVLTWLLKDSLGGNSKTIMIATVSPSASSYNETLSTLRYAAHARNIVNKPRVNEDANVRLIRELREEIDRLKSMLLSFELQRNPSPSLSDERDGNLSEIVLQNELKVEQLTKDWSESWRDKKELLERYSVDINRDRAGFLINSLQPHLVSLDGDVLSTGVIFYHLREGITHIGPQEQFEEPHIVLQGNSRCEIENHGGVVTLRPLPGCACLLNDREVTGPCRLAQGTVITLGGVHRFRFNHPAEAAILRERRRVSEGSVTCTYVDFWPPDNEVKELRLDSSEELQARRRVEEQKRYVESLRQEIQAEQRRAEGELDREQAQLQQQYSDMQQWILHEKLHLKTAEERVNQDSAVQTDLPAPLLEKLTSQVFVGQKNISVEFPSKGVRARKKIVQDELLKHHAVCRAEGRVRRKKLLHQLQKIANKRHLLDAKRKLQQLESTLPPGPDSPQSPEMGSTSKLEEPSFVSRRHSFSLDLLSRLYPQRTPIFRHFLKRNKSVDRSLNSSTASDSISSRTWVSEQCLSRGRTQSCSGSISSGQNQNTVNPYANARQTSKEKPQPQPCLGQLGRKPLLPNRVDVLFRNRLDKKSAAILKSPLRTASLPVSKENVQTSKTDGVVSDKSCFTGGKGHFSADSNGTKPVSRSLCQSVGPRIKTALSKVFRKAPPGVKGRRGLRPLGRIAGKFPWRRRGEKSLKDSLIDPNVGTIKATVSCEELDGRNLFESLRHRRWHSTEALMDKSRRAEGRRGLSGWVREQEEGEEGTSDCESLFSLDSLSSAYAAALAERLTREDSAPSDAESNDSEMSKDSLTSEHSGRFPTVKRRKRAAVPTYSRATDPTPSSTQNRGTEGPRSDLCRSQRFVVTPSEAHVSCDAARKSQSSSEADGVRKLIDDFRNLQTSLTSSRGVGGPENLLAPTDFWSSVDVAESPSPDRDSLPSQRKALLLNAEPNSSSPSPVSGNLSDSQSESRPFGSEVLNAVELDQCPDGSRESDAAASENVLQSEFGRINTAPLNAPPESVPALDQTGFLSLTDILQASSDTLHQSTDAPDGVLAATAPCRSGFPSAAALDTTPDGVRLFQPPVKDQAPGVRPNYFRNAEGGSVKREEPNNNEPCVALQQEVVKAHCKNSRKRNKDHQNAFMGCLKIPKRSDSGETETFSPPPGDSLEGVQSDDNSDSRDSKGETNSQGFYSSCADGDDGADSDAADSSPGSDLHTAEPEPSGQVFESPLKREDKGSQCDASVRDNEFVKSGAVRVDREFEVVEGVKNGTDSDRKRDARAKHTCRSEAICSAIDLRISEVIKEHVESSGGINKSQSLSILSSSACPSSSDSNQSRWTDDQRRDERSKDVKDGKIRADARALPAAEQLGSYVPPEQSTGYQWVENTKRKDVLPQKVTDEATRKVACPPDSIILHDLNSDLVPGLQTERSSQQLLKRIHETASASNHNNGNCCSSDSDDINMTVILDGAKAFDYPSEQNPPHLIQGTRTQAERSAAGNLTHLVKADRRLSSQITFSPVLGEHFEPGHKARGRPAAAHGQPSCPQVYVENVGQASVVSIGAKDTGPNPPCHFNEKHQKNSEQLCSVRSDKAAGTFPFNPKDKMLSEALNSKGFPPVKELQMPRADSSAPSTINPALITGNPALKKKKTKRFRKSDVKSRPAASSDSSLTSSDEEEEEKGGNKRHHCRLESKCFRVGRGGEEESRTPLSASNFKVNSGDGKTSAHIPKRPSLPPDAASQRTGAEKSRLNAKQSGAQHTPHCHDSPIHFASSDINPFVHQWQHSDPSQHCYKTPVFGSAADLSCKSPLLNSAEKRMVRCSSVDNGLNGQNSPFNSHLSTYATNKGLSSTLSSIEDYAERVGAQLAASQKPRAESGSQTTNGSSSGNDGTGSGLNSSQVDEIVLVYSSEHESKTRQKQAERRRMREHGTQTESGPGAVGSGLKRRDRHKRSSTDAPSSQRSRGDVKKSPTLASMETMSAHLSKLIHSTSDLLGDVQGMRSGEASRSSPRSVNSSRHSLSYRDPSGCSEKDRSTQTPVDAAVQTEELVTPMKSKGSVNEAPREQAKSYEVRVIVKVIGPEDESVHSVNETQGPPHLRFNVSAAPRSDDDPLGSPCTKTAAGCHRRAKSASSQVAKQSIAEELGRRNAPVTSGSTAACFQGNRSPSLTSTPSAFFRKQATFAHRASSPISPAEATLGSRRRGKPSVHCQPKCRNPQTSHSSKEDAMAAPSAETPTRDFDVLSPESETISLERVTEMSRSSPLESGTSSASLKSSFDTYTDVVKSCKEGDNRRARSERNNHIFPTSRQADGPELQASNFPGASGDFCTDAAHPRPFGDRNQLEEDDAVSLAQSECDTDVLVNTEAASSVSPRDDRQKVPDDLPLHNKFTNWSGVRHRQQSRCSSNTKTALANGRRNRTERDETEAAAPVPEAAAPGDRRSREILKLRQERERVMATVSLSASLTPLTVELTEAKLHYGRGETDALLKMLSPRSREERQPAATKNQLYDSHRRSIEVLRREREERLQTCRRARSLSPGKHGPPQEAAPTPDRRTEHQHLLSQGVGEASSLLYPVRGAGQCPPDIEQLLRDYSRAREEARTEIAKARERLRERTELEKQRILQQSQGIQEDLKHRTIISSSTLCTGSSLSLSSGPTSGYNSGNTAPPQLCNRPAVSQQIVGVQGDGWKLRARPPVCGFQSVKAKQTWLSAHDVRLELPVGSFEPAMTSSPSPPVRLRQRAASFGSVSSLSTAYQDITSTLIHQALAEVRLASFGDLSNLNLGNASAGWSHQGEERGVRAYYKCCSSPSVHGFLGAGEVQRPLDDLWNIICQMSKSHLYNQSVRSVWTRPLDDSTQLVYILTDPSACHLSQPRDFCCISTQSKQGGLRALALQSVFEETLPRPSVDAIRGEVLPSCWILEPVIRDGRELTRVIYLLQVDLGTPSFPQRLLNTVARRQAAVIANLDDFLAS
ncbi:uncharacterized protein stard9 [Fundulus diaphanus]